jgi:hypothetical protein
MFSTPNATLLSALSKLGAGPLGDAPQEAKFEPDDYTAPILNEPWRFPPSWVLEAERLHSLGYREAPLEVLALEEQWLPKIPRL